MPQKERHAGPNPERDEWDSKWENSERAPKHYETKKDGNDLNPHIDKKH